MEYGEWTPPEEKAFNYPMFGVNELFYNYVYEDVNGVWVVIENKLPDGRFTCVYADTPLDAAYIAFEYLMKDGKRMDIFSHEFFSGEIHEYEFDLLRRSYNAWREDYEQRMYSRQSRIPNENNERGIKGFLNRFL